MVTEPDARGSAHTLHVKLAEIDPPIWRDLVLPSDVTLGHLHRAIQAAMPWTDSHMHHFRVGDVVFSPPGFEPMQGNEQDERAVTLLDVLPDVGSQLTYLYDFGDDWVHDVSVLAIEAHGDPTARCLAGARCAPPDDCGGHWGYAELLRVLRDPQLEDENELRSWVAMRCEELAPLDDRFRGPFDPEAFDLEVTNRALGWPPPNL